MSLQVRVWLLVGDEQVQGFGLVLVGGQAVRPGGLQAGVPGQLGDGHQVGASADECGDEGVAQGVGRDAFAVEVGIGGDGGDDVAGAAGREPAASLVEEQCRPVRAGPVASFGQPVGEYGTQRRVEGDLADLFALAEDAKGALAGGDLDVVDVQADGLGDAGAGVEGVQPR